MNIMNLIHDICLTKNSINNTPKWKFITKNKQEKRFDKDISDFLNLDIFSASEHMISFLISLGRGITKYIDGYLKYNDVHIAVQVFDDNIATITNVTYYPLSNRFEIENDHVHYTIYRNTKISNHVNKMWEPLTHKIKKRYLEIIIQMAEYLVNNGGK